MRGKKLRGLPHECQVLEVRSSSTMNTLSVKGNWNEIKGKLKQKYANLTDDDLAFAEGKEEEMLGRLQKRTGRTKEELRREIEAF